jgi:uncharacterized damage-inducible protein DinB
VHDTLSRLLDHLAWADEQALRSLRGAAAPPTAALAIYAHIIGAEHVWAARITGRPARVAVWPELTLEACTALSAENHAALRAVLDTDALDRMVHYRNSAGAEFDSRVDDILLHVALHGAYHRGQVSRALREAGATPFPTDYIAFVRGAPAATREARRA